MTLNDLKTYLSNYAVLHKQLLHTPGNAKTATFFVMRSDKDIVAEFLRNNPMDRVMILLIPDKAMSHSGDNYTWMRNIALLILQRVPDKTDDAIAMACDTCEQISDDFVARILNDREILIDGIGDKHFDVQPAGPLGDNHYGVMCMFTQEDVFDWSVDMTRWNG